MGLSQSKLNYDDIYYNIDGIKYFYSMNKKCIIRIDDYLSKVEDICVINAFKKLVCDKFLYQEPIVSTIVYVREELDNDDNEYLIVKNGTKLIPANDIQIKSYISDMLNFCKSNNLILINNSDGDDIEDLESIDSESIESDSEEVNEFYNFIKKSKINLPTLY